MESCPCGTDKKYAECCGKFINGLAFPETPEELMRSRYTAYTEANVAYIAKTMKPPASQGFHPEAARQWAKSVTWVKLEVIKSYLETPEKGYVEFIAHYIENKTPYTLHEVSQFLRLKNQWFYTDGDHKMRDQNREAHEK